jgi:L-ascorbate metabolism protein UlaG (beta-lactamase superfamily)
VSAGAVSSDFLEVGSMRLLHVGGPTVMIEVGGWRLLTDPTFDPPGRRYAFGWGTWSEKQVGPAVAADLLPPIDAVLLSHDQHADNLDAAGRLMLAQVPRVVTTPAAARRLGNHAVGLSPGEVTWLERPGCATLEIMATPCRHGNFILHWLAGPVTGFLLRWQGQRHGGVWITGDTVLSRRVRRFASTPGIGTVLAHLGGVRFGSTGPFRYTMRARDLATLAGLTNARTIVPVHTEGWSHFESAEHLGEVLSLLGSATRAVVYSVAPGELHQLTV